MVVCLSRATPGDLNLMQLGQASGQMGNTNSLKMTWEKKFMMTLFLKQKISLGNQGTFI